jgi:uncharacterized protein
MVRIMPKNRVDCRPLSTPLALACLILTIALAGCAINPAQEEKRLLGSVATEPLRQADALAAQGKASEAAEAISKSLRGLARPRESNSN